MPNHLDELREIERLLREAETKLGLAGTFRQRTLLQMALFEIRRDLAAEERRESAPPTAATKRGSHSS